MRRPNLRDPDVADAIRAERKDEHRHHAACRAADDAYYAALAEAALEFNEKTKETR